MRIEGVWRGFIFISLALALALSLVLHVPPVLAPGVVREPGGTTIVVASGDNFVVRFRLRWDLPGSENQGYFSLAVCWASPSEEGTPSENFTFLGASAYFDLDGDNLPDNDEAYIPTGLLWAEGVVGGNMVYTVVVDHTEGDPRDGEFNVDLLFGAWGWGGVPHVPTENHSMEIVLGITVPEGNQWYDYTPPNRFITVRVLGRGVTVEISPAEAWGPPGETLSYEVTVTNTGEVNDNFSLEATDELGWGLELTPTTLEVPAGESRQATLSVTIPSSATPGEEDVVTVVARGALVENSATCIACVATIRGVSVKIAPKYQSGLPGQVLNYEVTVRNVGNVPDTYVLSTSDDLNWIILISPITMSLAPGQSENATLSVSIPVGAKGSTEDNVVVTAISQENNEVKASDSCVAHVIIIRGVEVDISPTYQSAPPESLLEYVITIKNVGNVDDSYDLTANDNLGWTISLSPTSIMVPAGEDQAAALTVAIPEDALGCTEDNVIVIATSTSDPTTSGSAACIAHVAAVRSVEVEISPKHQGGLPGATLVYKVAVRNSGNVFDSYVLTANDNLSWILTISPSSLALAPKSSENVILEIGIPDDALPCTVDNVTILATSQVNPEVGASDTCTAHVVGFRTELMALIYPTADIYAYGEFEKGYSRTQLKFDISNIPAGSNILSARLWLYRLAASDWDGRITLYRVDNQIWDETITPSEFDLQVLTDRADFENKFMVKGWDFLNVLDQFRVDLNAKNVYTSFRLMWADDDGIEPSIGMDDGRFLMVNSESIGMNIIFCSSEYGGGSPYLEVTYVPPYAVSISVFPEEKSGLPNSPINYVVTIANTGNLEDTYDLVAFDNMGWGLTITPPSITLAPGTLGEVTLYVAVPENVLPCTKDNVIITAISRGDPTVSASTSCMAHRLKGEFDIVTVYKVSLDADIYLGEGSRLVVKFYTWTGIYQGEAIVWTGMTPTHVVFTENVPHPQQGVVENAVLTLTDDAGNVISTFTSFILTRSHMTRRRSAIKLRWPYAPIEERVELTFELSTMKSRWPYAPA